MERVLWNLGMQIEEGKKAEPMPGLKEKSNLNSLARDLV